MVRSRSRHRQPKAVALWRYEQIEPALAVRTREARGALLRGLARVPVLWLSGVVRRISLATLYRWLAAYVRGGLEGLRPKRRNDAGRTKAVLPAEVVQRAYALLADDPEISFTLLRALLYADSDLDLKGRSINVARSTLARRLQALPGYARLMRARLYKRRRGRFVARRPHEIWHLDAKGPITVRLRSGRRLVFHVLSVIDDASRACLAAIVAPSPDLCAAVRVFRLAAKRWGLPDFVYADRASIFDSVAFRSGLAQLGSHRIRVRPRNPEANGKIEAYHRVLVAWYSARLARQQVVDLEHLQMLLDAVIEVIYQDHVHRQLRRSPRAALDGQCSPRRIAAARLEDAFREERVLKAHPKTGEVQIAGATYLVAEHLRGQRLTFLVDPEPAVPPLCVEPGTGRTLALTRAAVRSEDHADSPTPERWGRGPLQALYDAWQGKRRPVAEPGFGLPEVFALLAEVVGRPVPRTDAEAALIQRRYRQMGPLPKRATEATLRALGKKLGKGRPIESYLDALAERVAPPVPPASKPRRSKR
jgi:transposase InsO family protein